MRLRITPPAVCLQIIPIRTPAYPCSSSLSHRLLPPRTERLVQQSEQSKTERLNAHFESVEISQFQIVSLLSCYSNLHRHVKALESRSSLLDAALASADEANRRWEECRALVDQLRVENAALRATLSQAHLLPPNLSNSNIGMTHNGTHQEELKQGEPSDDPKNTAEAPSDLKQD